MKQWQWIMIWIAGAAANCVAQPELAALPNTIKMTLPAEVVVDAAQVRLSSIVALDGTPALIDKAGDLMLGTFVSKGQVLWVDRNTILSRLASIGIDKSSVELSGADSVKIKRREAVIDSNSIAQAAKAYLEKQLADQKIALLTLFRQPTPMTLDDPNASVELTCRMSRYQTAGSIKVEVAASQQGIERSRSEAVFTVRYKTRQLVALKDIESGEVATTDNVRVQDIETPSPGQKNVSEPYGMLARRKIVCGAVVHPDSFIPRQPPILIRRNQQVLVTIDNGGLFLSAPGQALDEGRIGDLIRIRRGQRPDEVTIYATVQPDGTVQPQL